MCYSNAGECATNVFNWYNYVFAGSRTFASDQNLIQINFGNSKSINAIYIAKSTVANGDFPADEKDDIEIRIGSSSTWSDNDLCTKIPASDNARWVICDSSLSGQYIQIIGQKDSTVQEVDGAGVPVVDAQGNPIWVQEYTLLQMYEVMAYEEYLI